jgi:L-alanine-DL-glutamate epimerase-like enolase superfamily enzyme
MQSVRPNLPALARTSNITAIRPEDVAREGELLRRRGCRAFVLRAVAHGGMLDRERLGAARYAAGFQASVVLEVVEPAEVVAAPRR